MRRIAAVLILFTVLLTRHVRVFASSESAYRDYLYQYDVYRQKYNDFKISKNEYDKFKTLTSKTHAIDKTRQMLESRDTLLKSYLMFLNEKINENKGMSATDKALYQGYIKSEVDFLNAQVLLVPSIGSINDALDVSKQLESHYDILITSINQTIVGLTLGDLADMASQYDYATSLATVLVDTNRMKLPQGKITISDRWLLSIKNKRTLFQQKINSVSLKNSGLKSTDVNDRERIVSEMMNTLSEAKTDLMEGTSYIGELLTELKYRN